MRKNQHNYLPTVGIGVCLLSSLPGCIPGYGIWLLLFTCPLLLLGSLVLVVSDASARFKLLAILLLVFGPVIWQCIYFSSKYHYYS